MILCEKCLHEEVCDQSSRQMWSAMAGETECSDFKNKADLVEVVRCKDCRSAYINSFSAQSGVALCRFWTNRSQSQVVMQQDDFCSYGERREEEDNGKIY